MSKGKYSKNHGFNVRPLVLMLAVALLLGATIGGTIAWLTASTKDVVNTFTVGNIDITLEESDTTEGMDANNNPIFKKDFKMVPGNTLDKDPKVSVVANSEACWLFVKVVESSVLDSYITYDIADGWTELTTGSGIYYREVSAENAAAGVSYNVLNCQENPADTACNGCVKVNENVTKQMMDALEADNATQPTLTFTAYAVQKDNITSAADAWAKVTP